MAKRPAPTVNRGIASPAVTWEQRGGAGQAPANRRKLGGAETMEMNMRVHLPGLLRERHRNGAPRWRLYRETAAMAIATRAAISDDS